MSAGRAGRRLLAFGATAVLPFLSMPVASAQSSLTVEITGPGEGATVAGTFTPDVTGNVYTTGLAVNVDVIRVVVTRGDGTVAVDRNVCCDTPRNGKVPFSLTAPNLSSNGPYTVRVTAAGHFLIDGVAVAPQSADRRFAMAVPPAPPNLAQPQIVDRAVKLTWTAGRADPDIMGYAVFRKIGTGPFVGLAGLGPNILTYTDTKTPPDGGAVQYRVDAFRQGAVISGDAKDWLTRPSAVVTATVPPPPTTTPPPTQPGETTTSTTPGGGLQPDGAVTNTDLGSLFGTGGGGVPSFPTPTFPAIPDPGFDELLPFPSTSAGGKVGGRQQALTGDSSGDAGVDDGDLDDSNRRALLVPVAGGSVLCVAALHLRWLNRRIAIGAIGAAAAGASGSPAADLEPAEPDPEAFAPDREPVGAGSPAGRGRG